MLQYIYLGVALLILALVSFSCKGPKETDDAATLTKVMELQKNPCFGKCPYYVLSIYEGRIAVFEGRAFVEKFGTHTKKLSRKTYKQLLKAFKAADFWSLQDEYESNIVDAPKIRLEFTQNDKTKNVLGDINRPQVIKDLEKMMDELANSDGWTLRKVPEIEIPKNRISDELVITLRKDITAEDWLKRYPNWGMTIKEKIVYKSRNRWLFKYDSNKVKPSQVMNQLTMDEYVIGAEFNTSTSSD